MGSQADAHVWVSFLRYTHSVSLPLSLYVTCDAVVFRDHSGHSGILCGMIENPIKFLFARQKAKKTREIQNFGERLQFLLISINVAI